MSLWYNWAADAAGGGEGAGVLPQGLWEGGEGKGKVGLLEGVK